MCSLQNWLWVRFFTNFFIWHQEVKSERILNSSQDFTEIVRVCPQHDNCLVLLVEICYLKQNQCQFISLIKKYWKIFIHIYSLWIVKTENETQCSQWHLGTYGIYDVLQFLVYCVYCVSQYMVVSCFHQCALMPDMPLVPKHVTVGYLQAMVDLGYGGFTISYFTFVSRMFSVPG